LDDFEGTARAYGNDNSTISTTFDESKLPTFYNSLLYDDYPSFFPTAVEPEEKIGSYF